MAQLQQYVFVSAVVVMVGLFGLPFITGMVERAADDLSASIANVQP